MAFETIFGQEAWLDLKECTSIATWKKYTNKLLRAIRCAVEETVKVRDDYWFVEICQQIEHGLQITKGAKSIDELLSGLSATLIKVGFLQIGLCPNGGNSQKVTLARDNWRLDIFRTVQYVQSRPQFEALFWHKQQRDLGYEKQRILWDRYWASGSKGLYSQWCAEYGA